MTTWIFTPDVPMKIEKNYLNTYNFEILLVASLVVMDNSSEVLEAWNLRILEFYISSENLGIPEYWSSEILFFFQQFLGILEP